MSDDILSVCYHTFTLCNSSSPTPTHTSHSFFFEKLRLLEGHGKSEERLRNEALFPDGFSTSEPDAQFGSHDLLQESDEDSETDLKCDENFA